MILFFGRRKINVKLRVFQDISQHQKLSKKRPIFVFALFISVLLFLFSLVFTCPHKLFVLFSLVDSREKYQQIFVKYYISLPYYFYITNIYRWIDSECIGRIHTILATRIITLPYTNGDKYFSKVPPFVLNCQKDRWQ